MSVVMLPCFKSLFRFHAMSDGLLPLVQGSAGPGGVPGPSGIPGLPVRRSDDHDRAASAWPFDLHHPSPVLPEGDATHCGSPPCTADYMQPVRDKQIYLAVQPLHRRRRESLEHPDHPALQGLWAPSDPRASATQARPVPPQYHPTIHCSPYTSVSLQCGVPSCWGGLPKEGCCGSRVLYSC